MRCLRWVVRLIFLAPDVSVPWPTSRGCCVRARHGAADRPTSAPRRAVSHDVDGCVDGVAHRLCVGLVLPRNVESRAVVGRGAHFRQPGREVHAVGREALEGGQPLVVVHGQDAVVAGVAASGEKPVGRKGAERQDALSVGFDDGGLDDLLFFGAEQAAVARMGIQRHDGDAGFHDAEVFDQRAAHRLQVADDLFPGDAAADLRDGYVLGNQSYAQDVAAEDHQRFALQFGAQKFGVARMAEVVALHRLLVERRRHQGVDASLF